MAWQLSGTPGSIDKKTFKEGVSSLAFEDDAFVRTRHAHVTHTPRTRHTHAMRMQHGTRMQGLSVGGSVWHG